jgi:hypothetical protein
MDALFQSSENVPLYRPLDNERLEIRLLKLLPPHANDTRSWCDLITYPLSETPEYVALSYVWGDPNITEEIAVNKKGVLVTTNLTFALESIQSRLFPSQATEEGSLDLRSHL